MVYRNAAQAFVSELAQVRSSESIVTVRGKRTHEILAQSITLQHPTERCITVPGRRNDVFATIAETMWVLAGRNDLRYLSKYLKRAPLFSDDGLTWRGAYGPRLRNWEGVDQLNEIRKLIKKEEHTRRAVGVLFDPAHDFIDTLDVPCNNWLHFLLRDGRLLLNIALRSNDIIWGFSGINTFEWSVLHEMMAFWVNAEVGRETFFISSLHLYDDQIEKADHVLQSFSGSTGYEDGWLGDRFQTSWDDFDKVMKEWFRIEDKLSTGVDCTSEISSFPDPMLRQFLQAISIKWAIEGGVSASIQHGLVDELGHNDLALALHEQLFHDSATLVHSPTGISWDDLRDDIISLHREKESVYGDSWKKRGELVGIAGNLARKIDRMNRMAQTGSASGETLLDTAIDLLVYAIKYETYLADQSSLVAMELFGRTGSRFSDGTNGFEELIRLRSTDASQGTVQDQVLRVSSSFDGLDEFLQTHIHGYWVEKHKLAEQLSRQSQCLVLAIAESERFAVTQLQHAFSSV
ncbi:thymidylate synthase [Bifidobacterium aquikefiri]|uniref:thymidylate synthase n=1 Tax=Bifidobacterium aquikefiri TaxID=1653207 RepID=UPI0039EA0E23